MNTKSRYKQQLPEIIRIIGNFIAENAETLAQGVDGTTDYTLTISLKPGDDNAVFEPKLTTSQTNVILPAFRYYWNLDG